MTKQTKAIKSGAIITDCADDNARVRQELRFARLFGAKPAFLGVGADAVHAKEGQAADIKAAGNLIDALGHADIMLVNVAPRGESETDSNGTPFCYFYISDTLVVSTYTPRCLGLLRDLGYVDSIELMDVPTVTAAAVQWDELTEQEAERINNTQFRSLEFLPLAARWVYEGRDVPSQSKPLDNLPAIQPCVWWVDNFGNAKTTLRSQDIDFQDGNEVKLSTGQSAVCHTRLADVPRDTTALVKGSSGYGNDRFLEIVVQRGNAAAKHNLEVGSTVF